MLKSLDLIKIILNLQNIRMYGTAILVALKSEVSFVSLVPYLFLHKTFKHKTK